MLPQTPTLEFAAQGSRVLATAMQPRCTRVTVKRGRTITREGQSNEYIYFLEAGFAAASKRLDNSRQQVVALFMPGDILNHELITIGSSFSTTCAIETCRLARVSLDDFQEVLGSDGGYWPIFLRFVGYQGVLAQERLVGLGRRTALERTAHLLCELFYRLRMASIGIDDMCPMPLTQKECADVLGLSLVQQNRSLRSLCKAGLVQMSHKRLAILDWTGLAKVAHFQPGYLDAAVDAQQPISSWTPALPAVDGAVLADAMPQTLDA